ncbi:MAG: hypothetical protein EBU31_14185 [Proteobacteria bacterium]|nr:hypothetical protein [Pseudomonadota bacterium]
MSMTSQIISHAASKASALAALAQSGAASEPTAPTFWMPTGASTIAGGVDHTLDVINWICYVFFALILVLMVYFVVKYRHRKGERFRTDFPHHNTPLEVTWSIIPTIIVIGIFVVGFRSYLDIYTAPKNAFDIKVTAQKWAWSFQYRTSASSATSCPAATPTRGSSATSRPASPARARATPTPRRWRARRTRRRCTTCSAPSTAAPATPR